MPEDYQKTEEDNTANINLEKQPALPEDLPVPRAVESLAKEQEKAASAASARPGKVEDIFNDEQSQEKPAILKPKELDHEMGIEEKKPAEVRRIIALIVVLALIGAAVYGSYWGYNKYFKNEKSEAVETEEKSEGNMAEQNQENSQTEAIKEAEPEAVIENIDMMTEKTEEIIKEESIGDTDKDGLSDKEEGLLGTNLNMVDTDRDGLSDREEVKVYKTDPLNPDTDGDGFNDGSEVGQGYNPKGSGKLYEIK